MNFVGVAISAAHWPQVVGGKARGEIRSHAGILFRSRSPGSAHLQKQRANRRR